MEKSVAAFSQWFKRHTTLFRVLFFGVVLFFVTNQLTSIFRGLDGKFIWTVIAQQGKWTLFEMFVLGFVGVAPLLLYDHVTIQQLEVAGRPHMDRKEWLIYAWATNTINHLLGFSCVISGSLRSLFYGKDVEQKKLHGIVSKVTLFVLAGLSIGALVAAVDVLVVRPTSPFAYYRYWLLVGGLFAPLLFVLTYFYRKTVFKDFWGKPLVRLYMASLAQWVCAFAVFWLIGCLMDVTLSIGAIYPIFILASGLGVLTMVPGGLGVFDVMMILGLGYLGLDKNMAIIWLLFYRIFYYLLPFVTGVVIFGVNMSGTLNGFLDNLPKLFSQKMAHLFLVGAIYFAGVVTILLSTSVSAASGWSEIFRQFGEIGPFSSTFFDQTVNALSGFLLLELARSVSQKVSKAFWPTILLLLFCTANAVMRSLSIWAIVMYLFVLVLLWFSREKLYRQRFIYSWGALLVDGGLLCLMFIFYAVIGDHMGTALSKHPSVTGEFVFPWQELLKSGVVGAILSLLCLIFLYYYLMKTDEQLGISWNEKRFNYLDGRYGGTTVSHRLRLSGYRYFYYRENGNDQLVFGFQIKGNTCFVLGDPIGNKEKWRAATTAFIKQVDRLDHKLAFDKISSEYAVLLHDFGFHFDRSDEMSVTSFAKRPHEVFANRFELKRLANEGYQFSYFEHVSNEVFEELKEISAEWLNGEQEKFFSVGRFDRAYIDASKVGIVRDPRNRIVGFITKQPIDSLRCSYDLVRCRKGAPKELPRFLAMHLIDELKKEGIQEVYHETPTRGKEGKTSFSFLGERILDLIHKYEHSLYHFQRETETKVSLDDHFSPRYFAYMKSSCFFFSALQLWLLIGKGKDKHTTLMEKIAKG